MSKIFGIGFHKTGTTSLGRALEILGYRVTGPNGVDDPDIAQNAYPMAKALVSQFDAFQDNPWPILFKEMDRDHPGSKFILTLRPSDAWIASARRHFGRAETPMRRWIYGAGSPVGNESIYIKRYQKHNQDVLAYFKDRPDDLLVMKITEGDGWEALCPFLGHEEPPIAFPHINKARPEARRLSLLQKLKRRIKGKHT